MELAGMIFAINETRAHARSAMPGAPVQAPPAPRPRRTEPVRRGTAAVLRRLADLVEPRAASPCQPTTT